ASIAPAAVSTATHVSPSAPAVPAAGPDEPAIEGEIVDEDDPLLAGVLPPDVEGAGALDAPAPESGVEITPAGAALIPLPAGQGVLVRDALTRYLSEVNRFPRLTADEEHDLAVRYHEVGDREAL